MPSPLNTPTGENMTIQQLFGKAGPKVESGGSDQPSWSLPSSATTPNLSMFCGNPEPKPQGNSFLFIVDHFYHNNHGYG